MPETTERRRTAHDIREFFDWWLDEQQWEVNDWIDREEVRAGIVTKYLVWRANRAMDEGVRRYVPVDGHDWHRKEEEHTAETS